MTGSPQFERRARTATMSKWWILQGGLPTCLRHAYAVLAPNRDPGPEFTRKLKSTLRIPFAGHTTVQVIDSQISSKINNCSCGQLWPCCCCSNCRDWFAWDMTATNNSSNNNSLRRLRQQRCPRIAYDPLRNTALCLRQTLFLKAPFFFE